MIKMLEKLNFCFEGECLGPNGITNTCKYYITAKTSKGGVQVTIDCESWIGIHCLFNEIYEDFTLKQLVYDLHEQNLENIEKEIADLFIETF